MAIHSISPSAKKNATQLFQEGQDYYAHWDIERAVQTVRDAISLNDQVADYFLFLAQAYVRLGDYEAMREALGRFIYLERDHDIIDRFEAMFGNAMDAVETCLTQVMSQQEVPLEIIGAGLQMWLEFRVTMGRKTIDISNEYSREWAATLDYTIRKINFQEATIDEIATWYQISARAIREKHVILIETLDVMPCDYRYFRGQENPLDKLVEAANMLEILEERFYRT